MSFRPQNASDEALPRAGNAGSLVHLAIFAAAVLPILVTPVLPMIDYYGHVARYYVLAHLDSNYFLSQNYTAAWGILPNIGLDVIGTGLMGVFPPLLTAKLIVLLIFATQYTGLLFFNRQLTGRASWLTAVLIVPLLYSFIFSSGFANFLLGLGLVFWGAGWALWSRGRPALGIPVACAIAVLIFLAHGVAFALYGILLGGLEIGAFLGRQPRSWSRLWKSMAALALQAVIPIMLFAASPTSQVAGGVTNADEAVRKLAGEGLLWDRLAEIAGYRLTTIVRVSESRFWWFDLLSFLAIAAILVLLAARGSLRVSRQSWPALALAVILIAIMPPALFGVGRISDRMPLFAAFLLIGALVVKPIRPGPERVLAGAVAALVVARLVLTGVSWAPYRSDFDHFVEVTKGISRPSVVGYIDLANSYRVDPNLRCEMYGPLLAPLNGHATPIFAFPSQQPIALAGKLRLANDSLGNVPPSTRREERMLTHFQLMATKGAFDYALVCGADRLRMPPPNAVLVRQSGRFALYRLSPRAS